MSIRFNATLGQFIGALSPTTNPNQTPFHNASWILSEILLWVFFIVLICMLVGLFRFLYHLTQESRGKLSKKRQLFLYSLCIVSIVIALIRNIVNQVVAFGGHTSASTCNIFVRFSYALYFFCMMSVFSFLWFRQIVFYSTPLLTAFLNPIMVYGSWSSLFVVIVGGFALIVLFVSPVYSGWNFAAVQGECRDISNLPNNFVPKLLIYFTVFIHIILLIFFLYPLLAKGTKPYKGGNWSDVEVNYDSGSSHGSDGPKKYGKAEQEAQKQLRLEQGERIITFVYKMCIITLLCVGVDVAITSGQFLIVGEQELIYLTLFDINLFINIVCIISSFNEWLHMMFPICCSRKSKRRIRIDENEYDSGPAKKSKKKKEAKKSTKRTNEHRSKSSKRTADSTRNKYRVTSSRPTGTGTYKNRSDASTRPSSSTRNL